MENYPNFSSFRNLMNIWEQNLKKEKIKDLIDSNLILFFSKDGEYFGCPEESRVVYAKLKNPDEDVSKSWEEEAAFLAYNLSKSLEEDEIPKRLFYKKDMNDIKMMDKEDLEKLLLGKK